eukprot:COSAG01_NODE_42906_length_433_cov_0.940476_1_plen_97_part_10
MSFSPSDYTLLGVVLQPGEELPSVPPDRPAIFQPEVMRTLDTEWWAGLDGGGTRGEGALPGSVTAPARYTLLISWPCVRVDSIDGSDNRLGKFLFQI